MLQQTWSSRRRRSSFPFDLFCFDSRRLQKAVRSEWDSFTAITLQNVIDISKCGTSRGRKRRYYVVLSLLFPFLFNFFVFSYTRFSKIFASLISSDPSTNTATTVSWTAIEGIKLMPGVDFKLGWGIELGVCPRDLGQWTWLYVASVE
jgi:hypothetical protein